MNSDQRQGVFGRIIQDKISTTKLGIADIKDILKEITEFYKLKSDGLRSEKVNYCCK